MESVRDTWYSSETYEIIITEREKMREFIERHLLRPMNANLYVNRTGKLSLAAITPPIPSTEFVTLTESDIVGAPTLTMTNESIINDVAVNWEYDPIDDEYDNKTVVLDATSQSEYDRDGTLDIKARGISSRWSGSTLATTTANRKLRNFKEPQPKIRCSVLFNKGAAIEPGMAVGFANTQMPDVKAGNLGINSTFAVVSKSINWATGVVDLELVRTNYGVGRVGLIAPAASSVDYTSASDDTKAKYAFVADSGGNMSNKDEGYAIV